MHKNKQFLILMYWHIWSWKTTLAKKIEKEFKINRINNDDIRKYFSKNILCYQNIDISYRTPITINMNQTVQQIRNIIIKDLILLWESLILDSDNIKKNTRKTILDLKEYAPKKIETIIIKCDINENELIKRLEKRDTKSNHKTKRKEFFVSTKKYEIEDLSKNEVNHILEYNQKNTKKIFAQINLIIQ